MPVIIAFIAFFAIVSLLIGLIYGWVHNIYWLFTAAEETTVEFWLALVGVVAAPIGIIHGWIVVLS